MLTRDKHEEQSHQSLFHIQNYKDNREDIFRLSTHCGLLQSTIRMLSNSSKKVEKQTKATKMFCWFFSDYKILGFIQLKQNSLKHD